MKESAKMLNFYDYDILKSFSFEVQKEIERQRDRERLKKLFRVRDSLKILIDRLDELETVKS